MTADSDGVHALNLIQEVFGKQSLMRKCAFVLNENLISWGSITKKQQKINLH